MKLMRSGYIASLVGQVAGGNRKQGPVEETAGANGAGANTVGQQFQPPLSSTTPQTSQPKSSNGKSTQKAQEEKPAYQRKGGIDIEV